MTTLLTAMAPPWHSVVNAPRVPTTYSSDTAQHSTVPQDTTLRGHLATSFGQGDFERLEGRTEYVRQC